VATLADTDPVTVALRYLRAAPEVLALLDGDPDRIRGDNRPPYPRVRLLPAPGDDLDMTWLLAPAVQVEAIGDLDGSPGPAALRRLLYTCLAALRDLPNHPTPAGEPVVTEVRAYGTVWSPLPNTQPRWLATCSFWLHPSRRV
jgi:hypothetical protein